MRNLILASVLALAGCGSTLTATTPSLTSGQTAAMGTAASILASGQLVCQVGPTALAMVSPSGAALLAKGATKAYVDRACAVVNGIAISPPAAGVPGTLVIAVPPAS